MPSLLSGPGRAALHLGQRLAGRPDTFVQTDQAGPEKPLADRAGHTLPTGRAIRFPEQDAEPGCGDPQAGLPLDLSLQARQRPVRSVFHWLPQSVAATASACSPLAGERPGASVKRRASTPALAEPLSPMANRVTRHAESLRHLDIRPPAKVSSIARARSASPRISEPANAFNSARCAAVASIEDRPAMLSTFLAPTPD